MYGMTEEKILRAKYKIKSNKAFMKSHGIIINDSIIPYDKFVANSYINSDRYIAELQHRAHSINEYAKGRGLSNLFISLTLPSEWHPMRQKSKFDKTMIFNKKFGGRHYIIKVKHPITGEIFKLLNTKEMLKKYSVKGASSELSKMFKKVQDSRVYKNIEKDNRCYFRVTEPHKDGTPHLHISLFVPNENIKELSELFDAKFPAPASKVIADVVSPVHYLMKYILKTLDDLRKTDDLTALSLWYIHHGIARFYTSRTFISLDIYRNLKGIYGLEELTYKYNNNEISIFLDVDTSKVMYINDEYSTIYMRKIIKETFGNKDWRQDMENEDNTYFEYEFDAIRTVVHQVVKDYYIFDGDEYFKNENGTLVTIINTSVHGNTYRTLTGILIEPPIIPSLLSDIQLYNYFIKMDINTVNLKLYGNVKNMLIERGFIKGTILSLAEYDKNFFSKKYYDKSYKFYSAKQLGLIEKINYIEVSNVR